MKTYSDSNLYNILDILFHLYSEQKLKWIFTFPFNHIAIGILFLFIFYISALTLRSHKAAWITSSKWAGLKGEKKHVLPDCNRTQGEWKKRSMQKVHIMSVYFKSGCKRVAWKHSTFLILLIPAFCSYEQQGEIMPGTEKKNSTSVWIMKRKRIYKQSYLTN